MSINKNKCCAISDEACKIIKTRRPTTQCVEKTWCLFCIFISNTFCCIFGKSRTFCKIKTPVVNFFNHWNAFSVQKDSLLSRPTL